LLITFVVAINLPYLNPEFMAAHDAKNFFAIFFSHLVNYGELPHWLPPNRQLAMVMGCNAPKIRFVSTAVFGNTDTELRSLISANPKLDTVAVLRGGPADDGRGAGSSPNPMAYSPRFSNANQLDLDIDAEPVQT
jgi:hypothetical protein